MDEQNMGMDYSKETYAEALRLAANDISRTADTKDSVNDIMMGYILDACAKLGETLKSEEEQLSDDICKAQAYQDYMEQLKQDGTETKNKDKPIVRIGSIDVNFYYGDYSFNPVGMKGNEKAYGEDA